MTQTTLIRLIHAPVEQVFATVADMRHFANAIPGVETIEYLTDAKRGVGARFRETRKMGEREARTEFEVTEFEENERIRIVGDTHGTVWDSVFTVTPVGDATELRLEMTARAHGLLARFVNPITKGLVRKAIAVDLDAVKAYCESGGGLG